MAITAKYACDYLSNRVPLISHYDNAKTTYISSYGVFNSPKGEKVVIRAADHGTFLFHWAERNKGIDLSQSTNIAITFKDNIAIIHHNDIKMNIAPSFAVKQYVYDCSLLETEDLDLITNATIKLSKDGVFSDPLIGTSKHASIWKEETNKPPINITTRVAKQKRKRERKKQKKNNNSL